MILSFSLVRFIGDRTLDLNLAISLPLLVLFGLQSLRHDYTRDNYPPYPSHLRFSHPFLVFPLDELRFPGDYLPHGELWFFSGI